MNRQTKPAFSLSLAASCLLLLACPQEQKPEPHVTEQPLKPTSQSIQAAKTTEIKTPIERTIDAKMPLPDCKDGPRWIGKPPCVKNGHLYAVGHVDGHKGAAARGAAANRARKRLALALGAHENDTYILSDSEVDQVFICGEATYALARVAEKNESKEFQACGPDQLNPAPLGKGCPEWTQRMAWKEGNTLYGVAPTYKVMSKMQRTQAATNRARMNVTHMIKVTLELTPDGVSAQTEPMALREKRRSTGSCNGTEYMMVAFEKGAELPRNFGKARDAIRKIPNAALKDQRSSEP